MNDKEDVLDKVRKLLAQAASTNFDGESESFTAKAEELMTRWAIEEWELVQAGGDGPRIKPVEKLIDFSDFSDAYSGPFYSLMNRIANHTGLITVTLWFDKIKVFGYEADVAYTEMLFNHIALQMARMLNPQPDPSKSEAANIYMLKNAGYKWHDVHLMMYPGKEPTRAAGVRFTRLYRQFAEENGLPRHKSTSLDEYRRQFAQSYVWRIDERLTELREIRNQAAAGKELVLSGRESDLREAFYEAYPDRRPHPADCACSSCKPPVNTRPIRYRASRGPAYQMAAVQAARRAADQTDLLQDGVGTGRKGELNG